MLFRFTNKGVENIKASPDRVAAAKATFHKYGAEVKAFYFLLGRFDTMFLVEGSDESVAKASLAEASKGNVRTETLRCFSEDEYRRLIEALD